MTPEAWELVTAALLEALGPERIMAAATCERDDTGLVVRLSPLARSVLVEADAGAVAFARLCGLDTVEATARLAAAAAAARHDRPLRSPAPDRPGRCGHASCGA